MDVALAIIAWSFHAAWLGTWPEFNWDGTPTHDPRRFPIAYSLFKTFYD